jgi:hypothetical protein
VEISRRSRMAQGVTTKIDGMWKSSVRYCRLSHLPFYRSLSGLGRASARPRDVSHVWRADSTSSIYSRVSRTISEAVLHSATVANQRGRFVARDMEKT